MTDLEQNLIPKDHQLYLAASNRKICFIDEKITKTWLKLQIKGLKSLHLNLRSTLKRLLAETFDGSTNLQAVASRA